MNIKIGIDTSPGKIPVLKMLLTKQIAGFFKM